MIARFLSLFLAVEKQRCGRPDCCCNHEVVVVTPLGWRVWWVFMIAMFVVYPVFLWSRPTHGYTFDVAPPQPHCVGGVNPQGYWDYCLRRSP